MGFGCWRSLQSFPFAIYAMLFVYPGKNNKKMTTLWSILSLSLVTDMTNIYLKNTRMGLKVWNIIHAVVHILISCIHLVFVVRGNRPYFIEFFGFTTQFSSYATARRRIPGSPVIYSCILAYEIAFPSQDMEAHYSGAYNCERWLKSRRVSITGPQR